MMDIDRRGILGATVALPAWLSLGFSPAAAKTGNATNRLHVAVERARSLGKPLLVLIVPTEEASVRVRGELWGCYFANLSDDQALDLALCEVTCASVDEAESVLGSSLKDVDATTWALLLETDVDPARAIVVRGPLPNGGSVRGEHQELSEDVSDLGSRLEQLLRAAILPDDATRARRLAQCRALVHPMKFSGVVEADKAGIESIIKDACTRRGDLDRWAAIVRLVEAPRDPSLPAEIRAMYTRRLPLLADAVRIRLFESAPDGSTWMLHSMDCPPCGMGYVPPKSRFFLKFLTQ